MAKTSGYNARAKNKHRWRQRQWAEIRRRVVAQGKRPGDCVVLYLAGKEDCDRTEARKNGFSSHNLIAVDTCEENIRRIRQAGGVGICADLRGVLAAWRGVPWVDVVVADFCCGLTPMAGGFLDVIARCSGRFSDTDTVVAANFKRGQDPQAVEVRKYAAGLFEQVRYDLVVGKGYTLLQVDGALRALRKQGQRIREGKGLARLLATFVEWNPDEKHRAKLFHLALARNLAVMCAETQGTCFAFWEEFYSRSRPEYDSYRDTTTMDSVVFTLGNYFTCDVQVKGIEEVQHKVAAAKAIRTQRMNGTLKKRAA